MVELERWRNCDLEALKIEKGICLGSMIRMKRKMPLWLLILGI